VSTKKLGGHEHPIALREIKMARLAAYRESSPFAVGDIASVVGPAMEDSCMAEILVRMMVGHRSLAVPLQLEPMGEDKDTLQGVADWHCPVVAAPHVKRYSRSTPFLPERIDEDSTSNNWPQRARQGCLCQRYRGRRRHLRSSSGRSVSQTLGR
jgi:hypothetical protein